MPDPVTLRVKVDHYIGGLIWTDYREANVEEVLAHPAVLALVAERDRAIEESESFRKTAAMLSSYLEGRCVTATDAMPLRDGDPIPLPLALVCKVLADAVEVTPTAENYLGWGWTDSESGKSYNVIVQRADGKSPQQIAAEARADLAQAVRNEQEALGLLGSIGAALDDAGIEVSAILQHYPQHVRDLLAECARLQAMLDAERGERGPEGWRWEDFGRAGEWRYPTPTGAGSLIVRRSMSVRRWVLERWHDGEFVSAHDYALEAMEAADRAAEGREG